MRTEHIEFLAEISKVQSLNLASQHLCISVQALSLSIKKLEEELGFKILDSTFRGTQLTEKGEKLLEAGLSFIAKIQELQADIPERRVISGIYKINCVAGMMEVILPQFMIQFQKYHRNAIIEPNIVSYIQIIDDLFKGVYDCGLVFSPRFKNRSLMNWEERFEFVPIGRANLFCQANKNLHLAKQESISLKSMMKYRIISYAPENLPLFAVSNIFKLIDKDIEIMEVKYKRLCDEMLLSQNVVALGIGMGSKPFERNGLNFIPISDKDVYVEIGYIKLKDKKLSLESQMLMDMVKEFLIKNNS